MLLCRHNHIYHIITVLLITPIYSDIDAMIICLYACPGVYHIAIQIISSFSNIRGMLSKSLGQTVRISVAMHILFHNDNDGNELSSKVIQAAIEAVINFVEVCCQHTAYIAGHSDINELLKLFETGIVKLLAIHVKISIWICAAVILYRIHTVMRLNFFAHTVYTMHKGIGLV